MSKLFKSILILSAVVLFGAGCARGSDQKSAAESTPSAKEPVVVQGPQDDVSGEAVVEYKDGAFNPPTIRVLKGTKVTFVNKGTKPIWPASAVHPVHDICPGFDSLDPVLPGETYSYTFNRLAECPYHNHLAPGERGTVEAHEE